MRRGPVLAPRYPPSFGVLRSSHSGLDGESRFVGTCLKGLALCTGGGWSKGWAHRLTPVMWGSALGGGFQNGSVEDRGGRGGREVSSPPASPLVTIRGSTRWPKEFLGMGLCLAASGQMKRLGRFSDAQIPSLARSDIFFGSKLAFFAIR